MSSPAPASPSISTAPRPLQLVDGNLQSPSVSSCPSPTASGLSTPPPSARKFNPRRQSSIAYFPSDHTPTWDLRSPTTASGSSGASLKRSTSLNQGSSERLALKRDRRSLPVTEVLASPQTERPPLTLTEKHADLLRFIAQKESKCLELRSQLAAHEAELAQLKRKWERIVSRGMDRAYSSSSPHSSASGSLLSGAVKEGVQGVSRLLVAGLSDLSATPPSKPEPSPSAPRTPILPLRTGRLHGHTTTQSTSSVSTTATSITGGSSSVRLSQSSASSLAFDDPPCEDDEPESEELSEARLKRTSISVDGGTGIESPIEISPASASRATKLHRRKSREVPPPSPSIAPLSPSPSPLSISTSSTQASGRDHAKAKAKAHEQEREDYKKTIKRSSLHVTAGGSIPPAASIPGLGPLASPLASAWMGSVGSSVGKKWEELQKGETFTKSQKRASLLFSDVSSSIFAALASPSSTSSSAAAPSSSSASAPSGVSISTNPFGATLSPLSTSPSPSLASPLSRSHSQSSAQSLLDDDDAGAGADRLGSVLVPDTKAPTHTPSLSPSSTTTAAARKGTSAQKAASSSTSASASQAKSLLDDDDEEWNW